MELVGGTATCYLLLLLATAVLLAIRRFIAFREQGAVGYCCACSLSNFLPRMYSYLIFFSGLTITCLFSPCVISSTLCVFSLVVPVPCVELFECDRGNRFPLSDESAG